MNATNSCRSCLTRLRSSKVCARSSRSVFTGVRTKQLQHNIGSQPRKCAISTIPTRSEQRRLQSTDTQSHGIRYEAPTPLPPRQSSGSGSRDDSSKVLLQPNNLFHSMSDSPSSDMRKRAAFIKSHAQCPHPHHQRSRAPLSPHDPEARKTPDRSSLPPRLVRYECPDCGTPTYCSEDHWADDYEEHLEICETLRQINEDDHDMRSGRFFPEFEYPRAQDEQFPVNLSSWDTYMYSREYNAINSDRSMRQVTQQLTYPLTIGSVLHELSPYESGGGKRITYEGQRSLNALRYNLHPPLNAEDPGLKNVRRIPPPMRIFILGARAESSLPREIWHQLPYLFPRICFHLHLIGPESMLGRERELPLPEKSPSNPFQAVLEPLTSQLKISTFTEYYQTLHTAQIFQPFDPYFDCFVLFHPGLGHPASSHEWAEVLPQLLETKVPIICTGYTEWDMERDRKWVEEQAGGEMDVLMAPGENKFRSLRWDLNDLDPQDISCGNWGVWAFRGKRYEATRKDGV